MRELDAGTVDCGRLPWLHETSCEQTLINTLLVALREEKAASYRRARYRHPTKKMGWLQVRRAAAEVCGGSCQMLIAGVRRLGLFTLSQTSSSVRFFWTKENQIRKQVNVLDCPIIQSPNAVTRALAIIKIPAPFNTAYSSACTPSSLHPDPPSIIHPLESHLLNLPHSKRE